MNEDIVQENINRFFPYLMEVRKRVLFTASIFLITGAIGFLFYERIIKLFLEIFSLEGINIVFTSPFQFISLSINSGLTIGLIVTFPIIVWQLLSFLRPALSKKEFRLIRTLVPISFVLFLLGFTFGALMMKYLVVIIYQRSLRLNIGSYFDVSLLLSSIVITSALMGIAFQFPIVMTLLMRFKLVKRAQIARFRPWAYIVAFIFVLFLPPDDILSDFLLTLPLILLFEVTLALNRFLKS